VWWGCGMEEIEDYLRQEIICQTRTHHILLYSSLFFLAVVKGLIYIDMSIGKKRKKILQDNGSALSKLKMF
jgi:hypothetical protein